MINCPIVIAILVQLVFFGKFLHESIFTPLGTPCRVKCGLAAVGYLLIAGLLSYGLVVFSP